MQARISLCFRFNCTCSSLKGLAWPRGLDKWNWSLFSLTRIRAPVRQNQTRTIRSAPEGSAKRDHTSKNREFVYQRLVKLHKLAKRHSTRWLSCLSSGCGCGRFLRCLSFGVFLISFCPSVCCFCLHRWAETCA